MIRASDFRKVLIVADIEGSSGCWHYRASAFMTRAWSRACEAMTADVDAVARALLASGVERVVIQDFHRTGYNLLPERLPAAAEVVQGYRAGPVPGMGDPRPAGAALFIGLHAASGTPGFLAHTLTSRLADLRVNGRILPEVQLFAASLAPLGILPIFFSGCPVACRQAQGVVSGIATWAIDKTNGSRGFDAPAWRRGLAAAAAGALTRPVPRFSLPTGPLKTVVRLRQGPQAARKLANRWGFEARDDRIHFTAPDIHALYRDLIRICYLTPWIEKHSRWLLPLFNLQGRWGLRWVRRQRTNAAANPRP
jgi:D-aminopeptidase